MQINERRDMPGVPFWQCNYWEHIIRMVLTNPPFGKKNSVTYVTDEDELRRESPAIVRDDYRGGLGTLEQFREIAEDL
ncbi:MAG: hypothetical protein JXM73_10200 [Anaerolineae bacterium]|nr:hypothetical protein [Anaerolineae bacterium]